MELTEEEPQFAVFREGNMRKLGENDYIKSIARSAYYDRYLNLCADFINWKYIQPDMKKRSIDFLKYLLSFNVGIKKKFGYILDTDYDEDEGNNDDSDYDINDTGFDDL